MEKVFAMLLGCVFATSALACPNFTGTFSGSFVTGDFRETETLVLKQSGCEKIEVSNRITFRLNVDPVSYISVWELKQTVADNSFFWNGSQIVYLQKDVNTEHCDIRSTWDLINSNLVTKFRFECPGKSPSAWYNNTNVVDGTYFRQN